METMDGNLEIELFPALEMLPGKGGIPPAVSAPKGRFLLIFVASGMKGATMRFTDGTTAFRASGRLYEAVMMIVPHGAVFESEFDKQTTEAYVFDFSCSGLRCNPFDYMFTLESSRGWSAIVSPVVQLTTYDISVLRPMAERIFKASFESVGSARHLRGCLFLQALLGHFLTATGARAYSEYPAGNFFKEVEARPRAFTVKAAAKRMGFTRAGVVKLFKAASGGISPMRFKTAQSLHLALYSILETKMPFSVIAARLGFSSQSYFTQFIKRNTGKTPRELRAGHPVSMKVALEETDNSPKASR